MTATTTTITITGIVHIIVAIITGAGIAVTVIAAFVVVFSRLFGYCRFWVLITALIVGSNRA